MAKDYDVLNGMIENQGTVLQTAFDKGYEQGYEEGFSKNLAQARKEEYKRGYEARKAEESNSAKMIVNGDSDASYQHGLVDAWRCAKNVCEVFSSDRLLEILEILSIEKGLFEYPASEVISKIKEYENSQKCERCIRQYRDICNGCVDLSEFTDKEEYLKGEGKLKVGDEVIISNVSYRGKAVVTKIDETYHCAFIMFSDGEVNVFSLYDHKIRKTGTHYYFIAALLDSLKEVEDGEI